MTKHIDKEITKIPIGSMYAIYGDIYHQYTPVMLAYMPYMDPMGSNVAGHHRANFCLHSETIQSGQLLPLVGAIFENPSLKREWNLGGGQRGNLSMDWFFMGKSTGNHRIFPLNHKIFPLNMVVFP